jgi:hypothetical protein
LERTAQLLVGIKWCCNSVSVLHHAKKTGTIVLFSRLMNADRNN